MSSAGQAASTGLQERRLNIAVHAGFVLVGVVNTFLGPILPVLSVHWRLTDAQAGRLFAAQYAGAIIGAMASSLAVARFGYLRSLLIGYAGMSAAAACFGCSNALTAIPSIFFLGLFFGSVIPPTNVLVSEMHPARRAGALNVANFAWGVGAIAGPPVLVYFSRVSVLPPMLGMTAMLALVTLWLSRCRGVALAEGRSSAGISGLSALRSWMTPYAVFFGLILFLYVGAESSTYGWVASFAKRLASSPQTPWMLAQTVFWIGLIGSRVLAPVILRRLTEGALIMVGMSVANAGLLIILLSRGFGGVTLGAALAGLGMGPIFPTIFARFTERFGALAGRMAGFAFVIADFGAGSFPWAVGLVSTRLGGLRAGFMVPVAGAFLMISLQTAVVIYRSSSQRHMASRRLFYRVFRRSGV